MDGMVSSLYLQLRWQQDTIRGYESTRAPKCRIDSFLPVCFIQAGFSGLWEPFLIVDGEISLG